MEEMTSPFNGDTTIYRPILTINFIRDTGYLRTTFSLLKNDFDSIQVCVWRSILLEFAVRVRDASPHGKEMALQMMLGRGSLL
jgi:hypothetical protein